MDKTANNAIESIVVGRSFSVDKLSTFAFENYRCKRYREAFHFDFDHGEAWVFEFGVIVFWGMTEDNKQSLIKRLQPYIIDAYTFEEFEHFTFELGAESAKIHADHISLTSDASLERLGVSHALAQSVKLSTFERIAQEVIVENAYIPQSLAKTGKIKLSRRNLARLRGALFSTKSDILLNFNLLDTPDFFWDHPELEGHYLLISRYLDVVSRVTVLSKKLETISELLDMLANEQNHKHSSTLEWIIIILISVEIVLFFWH